ncbi:hypothetical protein D9M71_647630 [compost metagenome]
MPGWLNCVTPTPRTLTRCFMLDRPQTYDAGQDRRARGAGALLGTGGIWGCNARFMVRHAARARRLVLSVAIPNTWQPHGYRCAQPILLTDRRQVGREEWWTSRALSTLRQIILPVGWKTAKRFPPVGSLSGSPSLAPQCFHRLQPRRIACGIEPGENPNRRSKAKGNQRQRRIEGER